MPATSLNSVGCCQNPSVTFGLTHMGGRWRGVSTWTSYFEAHSFPLAFVQFWLFHVQRVSEQRLGFGFELHGPVPHGELAQRLALCARAFPALPRQAQVTPAPGGRGEQTHASETGTGEALLRPPRDMHSTSLSKACSPGSGGGGGREEDTFFSSWSRARQSWALPQPPVKSLLFLQLHI